MAEYFGPSTRASKRRKTGTYNTLRTTLSTTTAPQDESAALVDTFSTISKRPFGRRTNEEKAANDDSAYASKDDSVNGDENALLPHELEGVPVLQNDGNKTTRDGLNLSPRLSEKRTMTNCQQGVTGEDQEVASEALTTVETDKSRNPVHTRSAAEVTTRSSSTRKGPRQRLGQDNEHSTETSVVADSAPAVVREESQQASTVPDQKDQTNESETEVQLRSSGRARRRPRRFSSDLAPPESPKPAQKKSKGLQEKDRAENSKGSAGSPRPPKGILTPSRQEKRVSPRKSVIFDEKRIEEQLGFKDIDPANAKARGKTSNGRNLRLPLQNVLVGRDRPIQRFEAEIRAIDDDVSEKAVDEEEDEEEDILRDMETQDRLPDPALLEPVLQQVQNPEVEDDPHLVTIKAKVLSRLTSSTRTPMAHLDVQYNTLHALLSATITAGESNSLLLLGARGSGKSLLVNTALEDLNSKHPDDFHIIRLNGFLQTDDKLALREIWRQLGREMHVAEEETGEVTSYADTMASLLSVLSQPDELAEAESMAVDEVVKTTSKSVIFVLDEFDLFTTHPRQTLLYNLFDIAQARKAPIAVVGCSTRMDVVECLEKRVKSRFSHRWVHVPGMKSLSAFREAVRGIVCLPVNGHDAVGVPEADLEWRKRWNEYIETKFLPSNSVQALVQQIFYTTKSIPDLTTALYLPLATVSLPENLTASKTADSDLRASSIGSPPSVLEMLADVPTLHLSLLVAAARLDTIHNLAALNFNLVYSHYAELVTRSKTQRSASGLMVTGGGLRMWSKETARHAWEDLGHWEVIVPVTGLGVGPGEDGASENADSRMWRVDVSLDEVAWAVKEKLGSVGVGVGEQLGKWCREI